MSLTRARHGCAYEQHLTDHKAFSAGTSLILFSFHLPTCAAVALCTPVDLVCDVEMCFESQLSSCFNPFVWKDIGSASVRRNRTLKKSFPGLRALRRSAYHKWCLILLNDPFIVCFVFQDKVFMQHLCSPKMR